MKVSFIFSILLQALLYVICHGEACVGEWSTETTRYRVLNSNEGPFVYVSCRFSQFQVDGTQYIKCVGGQLPMDLPVCVLHKASCIPLKPPVFGSMKCSEASPELGSSCTFDCHSTHYLRGSHTRRCAEDLRWTGSQPRCIMKSECSVPPPLHQGTVTGCSPNKRPRYNDTCYFRCNEGYRLVGPPQLKCRLNGRLTDERGLQSFPRCEASVLINPPGQDFQNRPPRPVSPTYWLSCHQHNGFCSQICHQESKGVRCSCGWGYRLSRDGRNCIEKIPVQPHPEQPVITDYEGPPRPISPAPRLSCQSLEGYCSHHCNQEEDGVRCSCIDGYRLAQDGRTCEDVDECQDERLNRCHHQCRNTVGSYTCLCRRGYTSPDGVRCEKAEVDGETPFPNPRVHCQQHGGYCAHHCNQEPEGARCSCRGGFELAPDGRNCFDVDECQNETLNKCNHLCRNTDGSFLCVCREGYVRTNRFRCEDVDECSDDSLNKCDHICKNTDGGYICTCRAGFVSSDGFRCEGCRLNSYRSLADVSCRECPANSHTEGDEKTSINDCICNGGFTGNPGRGIPCTDIDECADGENFGCSHTCINTPGSAHCACPFGYQLTEDGKTCRDIDECSIKNGGCDGICHNTVGNFTCSCPQGYVDSPTDKYSCEDVDECAEANGGCSEECVNFRGGFHCFCSEGYHLHPDGKSCIPVRCPRVAIPHHSTLRCKGGALYKPGEMPQDAQFPVGAACRIKCDKGYHFREALPGIVCQKDGKWNASLPECRVLQCPPLSPPAYGDVYPESCKNGSSTVKQKCFFTCLPGYRIAGQETLTCRNNLTWAQRRPTECVPETEVAISCPDDDVTVELTPDEGWAEVQLTSPPTTLTAGPIRVSPEWVSLDRASPFPAGETEVTFSVTGGNKTADCSVFVIVLDKHPPVFPDCPDTLYVTSGIVGTTVDWEEPVPQDNVGIASVSRSLEPNSTLSPGLHFAEYVARDFAGNVGQCIFHINVTAGGCEDLADPENGEANCQEWMSGKICQPTCFDNYSRTPDFFACDELGEWTPADSIPPCLPQTI